MVVVMIMMDVVMMVMHDHGFFGAGEAGEADGGKTKDKKGFHLGSIRVVVLNRGRLGRRAGESFSEVKFFNLHYRL